MAAQQISTQQFTSQTMAQPIMTGHTHQQNIGGLGHLHGHSHKEGIFEQSCIGCTSSSGTSGLTHIDQYETGAYEMPARQGLGTKIKNAFRGLGGRKSEEEVEHTTYGPSGEKLHKDKFKHEEKHRH